MNWNTYKNEIKKALDLFEFDNSILNILKHAKLKNKNIFICGNGGSASTAEHYTCDLSINAINNWPKNTRRYSVYCLSSNISLGSAISNDLSYSELFKQQLINIAKPNDILILISCSGNSKNILSAANWAKKHRLITIGITGFSGGKLKKIVNYSAHIKYNSFFVAEDIHSIFGHFLTQYLK